MNQIFKYALRITDGPQTVFMPLGSRILSVQNQNGNLTFWALVDDRRDKVPRKFLVVGTGQDFDAFKLQYVGTAQFGVFVWHVFEETP